MATQWHAISYQLCGHSAAQCSTSPSIKHRLCVRTSKVALEYTTFIGKRVVENARQILQFYSAVCDVYIYQIIALCPVDYVPHTGRCFAVSYKMKTNVTWIYSASHFASVEGAQGFIVGFIFVFGRANGKPQEPIRARKDIDCLGPAHFIDRVCSLRGMKKSRKSKWGSISVNRLLVDYCNDFKLHQSSPSGSAFKFSCVKRMLLQAPETHLNRQEIVYLKRSTRFWITYSPAVWRCLISWPALSLTQVLTRMPATFLHPSHGIPTLPSDSWTSMRDSLTSGWNPGGVFLAAPRSTQRS